MQAMTTQEQTTLQRARDFDLDALAEVYDHYSPGIYRYALRLLGDTAQAEDCTAETFSRFLTVLKHGGGPEDHLQAYLYRIAHNWITDFYRRRPENVLLDEGVSEDGSPAIAINAPSRMEGELWNRAEVRRALLRLTPEQRQVIILKFLEGWETEEIAEALQKQVSAVKALQHRAIEALRRFFLAEEQEYER
jgi:RNA polymerase sigma-70 factor, ECF subfamily